MNRILAYKAEVDNTMFVVSFVNNDLERQTIHYKTKSQDHKCDQLYSIIENCVLVGHDNKTHDDILLNYIYKNKYIDIEELLHISTFIKDCKKNEKDIFQVPDIKKYMGGPVESIDIVKTPIDHSDLIYSGRIVGDTINNAKIIAEDLKKIYEYLDYGYYKHKKNLPLTEAIKMNFLEFKLRLRC